MVRRRVACCLAAGGKTRTAAKEDGSSHTSYQSRDGTAVTGRMVLTKT